MSTSAPVTPADIKRYRGYLQEEVDGIYTYEQLASLEEDEQLRDVYERLAKMEMRHLELWRTQLRNAGVEAMPGTPTRKARFIMWIAKRFGIETVLPIIKAFERDATDMYVGDVIAEDAGLPADEAQHARVFAALERGSTRGAQGSLFGRIENRHRSLGGGNALRAAVLGANDGLVSNLALIAGFAGAAPGQGAIILAGVAGLLAGASSMALGEWISVTSSREAGEAQIAAEREEMELDPQSEQDELALIYQAKGLPRDAAEHLAATLMADPEHALGALAREELGIVPEELGSPWAAAIASFILFAAGAIVPLLPFLFMVGLPAVVLSAVLSGLALFGTGAAITLLTGRSAVFGGGRQLVLGLVAAALTYVLGSLIAGVTGI